MSDRPPGDDTSESCPELDDAYFEQIDESFAVIDCWEDGKNDDDEDDSSVPPPPIIKEEAGTSRSNSSRSRKDSERSNNRESRSSKTTHDKERSKSPSRKRRPSPFRSSRPARPSPSRERRRNSPTRRNNAPSKNRPTFLDEMLLKIPELAQDLRGNNQPIIQNPNPNNFNNNFGMANRGMMNPGMNPSMMQGMPMMPQPSFNPYPNGFQPMMDSYGQPIQMNPFGNNVLVNQVPYMFNPPAPVPVPVPAPIETIIIPDSRQPNSDPRIKSTQSNEPPKKNNANENDLLLAKKKAFENGKISMSDYLRQMSQQKTKTNTEADISSKKSKVHERCKNAAKLLKDLSEDKVSMPFIFRVSTNSVPRINNNNLNWKSPLIRSDSNARFTLQSAGATSNIKEAVRAAVQSNPLRNIPSQLLSFGRNLGLDMTEISHDIQLQINLERRSELEKENAAAAIKKAVIMNRCHKDTQADFNCPRCEERSALKYNTRSSQTESKKSSTVATQSEEEIGGFKFNLNANMLRSLSREQEEALGRFCRAFEIRDDRFLFINDVINESENVRREGLNYQPIMFEDRNRSIHRESDDRMTYANPENPNIDNMFVSFSPPRENLAGPPREQYSRSPRQGSYNGLRRDSYSRSPNGERYSRSPKRRRVRDRLGDKVEIYNEPRQYQFDNFQGDNFDMNMIPSTSRHFRASRERNYRMSSQEYAEEYARQREHSDPRYSQREYHQRSPGPSVLPPVSVTFENSRSPPPPFSDRRGRY